MSGLSKVSRAGLAKYDPEKGLKTIAVLKMAAKEYARLGDIARVESAIRGELDAEAEFVLWWDTKGPGSIEASARHDGKRLRSATVAGGVNGLPDRQVVFRWRKHLNDPKAFEIAYERIRVKTIKSIRFESTAHVGHNSGENEWYTPAEYVEAARTVLGAIDLDPASTDVANEVVKAEQIYTIADNALEQQWDGRVFMNPPYSHPLIVQFCQKLAVSLKTTVPAAVVLVNNATETDWFRTLADACSWICFPTGRIKFWSPTKATATPLQGQALLYSGDQLVLFAQTFSPFGFITEIRK